MRIFLDARTVGRQFSGVGNYVLELIRAYSELSVDHEFLILLPRCSALRDLSFDSRFRFVDAPFSHENHVFGDLWEELVLPRRVRRLGGNVLHGPAFLIPTRRTGLTTVVTVHDLVAYTHPETIPTKYALYMRWLIQRAVRAASRVIVVSTSVKDDLTRILRTAAHRIDVIYQGVSSRFRPADDDAIRELRVRLGLRNPYLLFVGNLEPRKNLPGLLRAFRRVRERAARPVDLVVVGKLAWLSGSLKRELEEEGLAGSVHAPGFLDDADLPAVYSGAEAFVFPTFWEGFGLPVLEAMSCGTPVVASGISSIPEFAEGAAVLVDPASTESIADGILDVLSSPERREELSRLGRERARQFAWERTARLTLATYEAALRGGPK